MDSDEVISGMFHRQLVCGLITLYAQVRSSPRLYYVQCVDPNCQIVPEPLIATGCACYGILPFGRDTPPNTRAAIPARPEISITLRSLSAKEDPLLRGISHVGASRSKRMQSHNHIFSSLIGYKGSQWYSGKDHGIFRDTSMLDISTSIGLLSQLHSTKHGSRYREISVIITGRSTWGSLRI